MKRFPAFSLILFLAVSVPGGASKKALANSWSGEYAKTVADSDTGFSLDCISSTRSARAHFIVALFLVAPSGDLDGYLFSTTTGSSEIELSVGIETIRAGGPLVGSAGNAGGRDAYNGISSADGSVLRAAWAAWGGTQECDVHVDGIPLRAQPLGAADVFAYRAPDGSGGLGIAAGGAPGLGLALTRSHKTTESGGFVAALAVLDQGHVEISGPDGSHVADGLSPRVFRAGPAQGIWRYQATGVNERTHQPWLWYLRFPG